MRLAQLHPEQGLVDARHHQVDPRQGGGIEVPRLGLPVEAVEQVDPVDQDLGLVETNIHSREALPTHVGGETASPS